MKTLVCVWGSGRLAALGSPSAPKPKVPRNSLRYSYLEGRRDINETTRFGHLIAILRTERRRRGRVAEGGTRNVDTEHGNDERTRDHGRSATVAGGDRQHD